MFAAHEAGASRTRIRKSTGRKAEDIKTALAAGGMSAETRAAAGELAAQLTLDELALLAEFDGDPEAVERILEALRAGYAAEYVAERIRQDRAEAAQHEQLRRRTGGGRDRRSPTACPTGAARLAGLIHDGEDLTPEAHASCPGRGVYFQSWNMAAPGALLRRPGRARAHVRTSGAPLLNSERRRWRPDADGRSRRCRIDPAGDSAARSGPQAGDRGQQGVGGRRRRCASRWLASVLFARRAAPREAARFVARQLLTMPDPLRLGLAAAPAQPVLFTEVTGLHADQAGWRCATPRPAARLPLLMLAPIVTAYEHAMTDGEGPQHLAHRPVQSLPPPGRRAVPGVPGQHRLPAHGHRAGRRRRRPLHRRHARPSPILGELAPTPASAGRRRRSQRRRHAAPGRR